MAVVARGENSEAADLCILATQTGPVLHLPIILDVEGGVAVRPAIVVLLIVVGEAEDAEEDHSATRALAIGEIEAIAVQ